MTSLHPEAIQEPAQSHLIRTKYAPITPEIQGIQELHVRNWGQKPNIRTKDAPSIPVTQEATRVLEALCQKLGAETKHVFYSTVDAHVLRKREERRGEGRGGGKREGNTAAQRQTAPSCLFKRVREGEKGGGGEKRLSLKQGNIERGHIYLKATFMYQGPALF